MNLLLVFYPPTRRITLNQLSHVETGRRRQLNDNMNAIKSRLEKNFGTLANEFYDKIQQYKQSALADYGTDLHATLEKLNHLLANVRGLSSHLGPVEQAEKLCEEANIESNEFTDHTVDDLGFELTLVEKLINKNIAAVSGQLAVSTGSGISAEQMKEYKETFTHFDVDGDQTLNRLEFKSCLSALGLINIDFEGGDSKFEHIFQDISGGTSSIQFDNFVEYMNRLAGSTMDRTQIASSFNTLAGGKNVLTVHDCQAGGFQKEEIEYITLNLPKVEGGYDYNAYLKNSFK